MHSSTKAISALGILIAMSACVEPRSSHEPHAARSRGAPARALLQAQEVSTVVVAVSSDSAVRASSPNKNFGSSLKLDLNRSLVRVDSASLSSAVGPNDYVLSAALEFTLTTRSGRKFEPPRTIGLHRALKTWAEGAATFECAIDANPSNWSPNCSGATKWSMTFPSASFSAAASSTAVIPKVKDGVVTLDVTNDVRGFLSGALSNDGWLIKTVVGCEELSELLSRESSAPPKLTLTVRRCNPSQCSDGHVCTQDSCDSTGLCSTSPLSHGSCDDGNPCTLGDACRSGTCAGTTTPEGSSCGGAQVCSGTDALCVPAEIVINEVESNGGVPGDWVELYNAGSTAADVSGWKFKDADDAHAFYVIPPGTVVLPDSYLVLEEAAFGFGLGASDSARLFDASGSGLIDAYAWTAHAATTYGRCPNGIGEFDVTALSTKGNANDCVVAEPDAGTDGGTGPEPAAVVINEVESSGGVPGDWVELYNAGATVADVSGWRFKDADDTHAFYVIPAGTTIPVGGHLVLEEAAFGFGLGAADSARLYDPSNASPVDSYAWTAHAATTYGRCPNGTGAFTTMNTTSKGSANDCGGGLTFAPWPGSSAILVVDAAATFGGNLSGLTFQPGTSGTPDLLWASQNSPAVLFRLAWDGSVYTPTTSDDWGAGKLLLYPDGTGSPDAEGVTKAELTSPAIYITAERDNTVGDVSRQSILRFDMSAPGTILTATHEWNLTGDLPAVGANLGLEAIVWIPDSYLTSHGFRDEHLAQPYDPAHYPDHGTGVFFVAVEATGAIYAYALDHADGSFQRIATVASGQAGVMALDFDSELGALWAYCDNTCGNRATVLALDTNASSSSQGRFVIRAAYDRPAAMPNLANEGFAVSACAGDHKDVFFSDDGETDGHAIRRGSLPCGPLLP